MPTEVSTGARLVELGDAEPLVLASRVAVNLQAERLPLVCGKHDAGQNTRSISLFPESDRLYNYRAMARELVPGIQLNSHAREKLERLSLREDETGLAAQDFLRAAAKVDQRLSGMALFTCASDKTFLEAHFFPAAQEYRNAAVVLGLTLAAAKS